MFLVEKQHSLFAYEFGAKKRCFPYQININVNFGPEMWYFPHQIEVKRDVWCQKVAYLAQDAV